MKFIRKIFFIFSLVSILLIGTSFADTGKVNVSATRLRKENNTDSDIITNIYEDETVEIVGEAGEWYQVKYDGNTGYVKKEYLTVSNKEDNTSPKANTTNTQALKNETNSNSQTNTKNEVNESNTNSSTSETPIDSSKVTTNSTSTLRNMPSIISTVIAQFDASKQLTILEEIGNWAQVTDGVVTGWIPRSKIVVSNPETVNSSDFTNEVTENEVSNTASENKTNTTNSTNTSNVNKTQNNTVSNETAINKTGKINVETAKVRESASSSANVTEFLDYDDTVTIVAEDGEWYKITSSKASGYVNKRLITIQKEDVSSRNLSESREQLEQDTTTVSGEANAALNNSFASSNNGTQVAEYAKQYLGCSYVLGGKTPESGFDCSGFTRYVYSNFGYSLGSTAASQTSVGTDVTRENLQVGDLILFYNEAKTSIGHTGVYLGNGEFIHAANPSRGVVTDNLNTNSYYNERFVSAKRVLE